VDSKQSCSTFLRYLATCSSDRTAAIWKVNEEEGGEFEHFKTLSGHGGWVWDCEYTCDSAYLITGNFWLKF
jgi:G protein beta subunit-like protein